MKSSVSTLMQATESSREPIVGYVVDRWRLPKSFCGW